jgi:hypothetical protein
MNNDLFTLKGTPRTQQLLPPWVDLDGEKIADDRVREIFRQPPGAPPKFFRSSLIVGCRGVGKTTLLRYHKEVHEGIAVHISLATVFSPLTKQTGFGPLAFDIPQSLEVQISGKAISLLALSISARLLDKGIPIRAEELFRCLPPDVFHKPEVVTDAWLENAKKLANTIPIEQFETVSDSQALFTFVETLGASVQQVSSAPLLLLLDRADMVQTPALGPVFQLLDQSSHYVALVAMRPGMAGQAITNADDSLVAGDSYALVHLGTYPRSREWIEFVERAIRAQVGAKFSQIPQAIRNSIISLSRDSLRTALELVARYLSKDNSGAKTELLTAMEDLRENYLAAAQKTLQRHHPNFRTLVSDLRSEAEREAGRINGPIVLTINSKPADSLFHRHTHLSQFIDLALRGGSLCMPAGQLWQPGLRPTQVEIPPILVWQKGDPMWSPGESMTIDLHRAEDHLFRTGGGRRQIPTIFIAYRMKNEESEKFRRDVEEAIRRYRELSQYLVVDGSQAAGSQWAPAIRKLIKNAKAVIGDAEGLRKEVVVELGLAYGLRRIVIPTVREPHGIAKLPSWLRSYHLGAYGTVPDLIRLATSTSTQLANPEFAKFGRPPTPIPGSVVWLRRLDWNRLALDQFEAVAQSEGLTPEILGDDDPDEVIIRRASAANLLIVSLDGTIHDALMHYVCGAVAGNPYAGYKRRVARRVLIFERPDCEGALVAEGLKRCSDVVRVIRLTQIRDHVQTFGNEYKAWLAKPRLPRKKK